MVWHEIVKYSPQNLPIDRKMEYISVILFAEKYGISERTAQDQYKDLLRYFKIKV